jgi:Domain of unknown function (DUF4423)
VVELVEYRALPQHVPGFIAAKLDISREEEERCVALLLRTGQLQRVSGRLVPGPSLTVDTRGDRARSQKLKAFWAKVALARLEADGDGVFSYNLFSVSRADLQRIQELYRAYFREVRQIVAASEPSECLAIANVQVVELASASAMTPLNPRR